MTHLTESTLEETVLEWLRDLGYAVIYGNDIAPDEPAAERENYGEVILAGSLKDALKRLNPNVPAEALDGPGPRALGTNVMGNAGCRCRSWAQRPEAASSSPLDPSTQGDRGLARHHLFMSCVSPGSGSGGSDRDFLSTYSRTFSSSVTENL